MNTQFKIWLLLLAASVFTAIGLWQLFNFRGAQSRGRRRRGSGTEGVNSNDAEKNQRRSDRRQLTNLEKKLFAESQRLLAQGKVSAAARILEQLSMTREAIQVLEDHGLIHEAARILMRMQKNDRAGVIYARHGMWANAAQCFRLANMPLEAAKCARESGNFAAAADFFEKAERYEDAADCFAQNGNFLQASRLLNKANNNSKSIEMLEKAIKLEKDPNNTELQSSELERIINHMGQGGDSPIFAQFLAGQNKIIPTIFMLLTRGKVKKAAELYTLSSSDIGPLLMADINYSSPDAPFLAELFVSLEKNAYAGMVYEKLGKFELAGMYFENASDIDRAIYCYERGNSLEKSRRLRAQISEQHKRNKPEKIPSKNQKPKTASSTRQEMKFHPENAESTAIIGIANSNQNKPSIFGPDHSSSQPPLPKLDPPAPFTPLKSGVFSLGNAEDTHTGRKVEASALNSEAGRTFSSPSMSLNPTASEEIHPKNQEQINLNKETLKINFSASSPDSSDSMKSQKIATSPPVPLDSKAGETWDYDTQTPATNKSSSTKLLSSVLSGFGDDSKNAELDAFFRCKFLEDFSEEQKRQLWELGDQLSIKKDGVILDYSGNPLGLYIVTKGQVNCLRKTAGQEILLESIGPGDSFGELWLLTDLPTTVCFRAKADASLRIVPRDRFSTFIEQDGIVARKVYKKFTSRLLRSLLKSQIPQKNQSAS